MISSNQWEKQWVFVWCQISAHQLHKRDHFTTLKATTDKQAEVFKINHATYYRMTKNFIRKIARVKLELRHVYIQF